jgi:hypothetical protein
VGGCTKGDLGFIYGPRGAGKTWLVDFLAESLSQGEVLTDAWEVHKACNVLLIDGEMPIDSFRDRLDAFETGAKANDRLHTLHHELLFQETGTAMNLTNPIAQQAVTQLCITNEVKLLILDNLSCLFNGLPENDNDCWELVLNWLLDLRRRRIAVLIVHHEGTSGRMRGATRREDAAFWVIKLDEIKKRNRGDIGARFRTTFEKQRDAANPEFDKEWSFLMTDGQLTIGCTELTFDEKVFQLIKDRLTSCGVIAQELQVSNGTISKAARRLETNKFIEIKGSGPNTRYEPRGVMR